jgi:ATP adenylyltransferase
MDRLWSPWRYQYITAPPAASGCIFCQKATESNDAENLVVWRGKHSFVLLNLYPYTTGHLMVAPYQHVATLEDTTPETVAEMMLTARQAEKHLRALYRPEGLNLGMNIGRAAGAGIADHIHMHVLPRWIADANFMTTVGETRIVPEDLSVTYDKLSRAFHGERSGESSP